MDAEKVTELTKILRNRNAAETRIARDALRFEKENSELWLDVREAFFDYAENAAHILDNGNLKDPKHLLSYMLLRDDMDLLKMGATVAYLGSLSADTKTECLNNVLTDMREEEIALDKLSPSIEDCYLVLKGAKIPEQLKSEAEKGCPYSNWWIKVFEN